MGSPCSYPLCCSGLVTKSLWFIFSQISNSIFFPCRSVIMFCWWIRSLKNAFILTYWTYCTLIQLCRHVDHFDSFRTSPQVTWSLYLSCNATGCSAHQISMSMSSSTSSFCNHIVDEVLELCENTLTKKKGCGSSSGAASAVFVITVDKYVMENCGKSLEK